MLDLAWYLNFFLFQLAFDTQVAERCVFTNVIVQLFELLTPCTLRENLISFPCCQTPCLGKLKDFDGRN